MSPISKQRKKWRDLSPKSGIKVQSVSEKCDDLKFSVKRIRFHHGIEKLWLAKRMMMKRKNGITNKSAFTTWTQFVKNSKVM